MIVIIGEPALGLSRNVTNPTVMEVAGRSHQTIISSEWASSFFVPSSQFVSLCSTMNA